MAVVIEKRFYCDDHMAAIFPHLGVDDTREDVHPELVKQHHFACEFKADPACEGKVTWLVRKNEKRKPVITDEALAQELASLTGQANLVEAGTTSGAIQTAEEAQPEPVSEEAGGGGSESLGAESQ